tara:strand:+ start:36 stop:458 length:423 start_codon:yes stop_codon:yes gene_type:complete
MNSFFLIFLAIPAVEIFFLIKVGGIIGALNTVFLIFLTAIVGIYFAKMQGMKTMKSGIINIYQNKVPINEIVSGASIVIAAILLIVPGFLTDAIGFLLLIPFTRKLIVKSIFYKQADPNNDKDKNILDGEIVEDKNKDEL